MEWLVNYTKKEYPYFTENLDDAPTEEQKLRFVKTYIEEQGLDESPETILHEVKWFSMASHFLWSLWSVAAADVSQIPFGYWVSNDKQKWHNRMESDIRDRN